MRNSVEGNGEEGMTGMDEIDGEGSTGAETQDEVERGGPSVIWALRRSSLA
jgi:hypothetical protein